MDWLSEGKLQMANDDFFNTLFANFWGEIDRSVTSTDAHSMFGDAQVFDWLIDTVRPKTIIEIGSWKGHSANYMAGACKRNGIMPKIVCVDSFLGGPEHWLMPENLEQMHRKNGMPTILNHFLGNTIAMNNENCIFPLTLDSNSAADVLRHFSFKADLIFVDAGHEYSAVYNDITKYLPILAEDGVMWGDDYQEKQVADAVHDCGAKFGLPVVIYPVTRKWIYLTDGLLAKGMPEVSHIRHSFEGWVHP